MSTPTVMDILKALPKTNCRDCGQLSCLAFAALLQKGGIAALKCPHLPPDTLKDIQKPSSEPSSPESMVNRRDEMVYDLKKRFCDMDFTGIASRLGASMVHENLVLRCLGRNFELDPQGELHSECHINNWVHLPLLNYAVRGVGKDTTGEWVRFAELKNSADWVRFFEHRCERGMRAMAEESPELFFDSLTLFSARKAVATAGEAFAHADFAVVLDPLPKLPVLLAYWKAEGEFESTFSLFFDRSAEENLGAESIYMLVTGWLEMMKRILSRHTFLDR